MAGQLFDPQQRRGLVIRRFLEETIICLEEARSLLQQLEERTLESGEDFNRLDFTTLSRLRCRAADLQREAGQVERPRHGPAIGRKGKRRRR